MYCSQCGAPLQETDKFCMNCGTATNMRLSESGYNPPIYSPPFSAVPPYVQNMPPTGYLKATGGLKVWLWIIITINALYAIYSFYMLIRSLSVGYPLYTIILIVSILLMAAVIFAATRLMDGYKYGFYMFCGCAGLSMIINMLLGAYTTGIGNIFAPLILWLFARSQWQYFR